MPKVELPLELGLYLHGDEPWVDLMDATKRVIAPRLRREDAEYLRDVSNRLVECLKRLMSACDFSHPFESDFPQAMADARALIKELSHDKR